MSINNTILRLHKSGDLDAATELEILMHQRAELLDALRDVDEFLDQRADADGDVTGFIPNDEMRLLVKVRAAVGRAA